jgi:hypothetical protein
MMEERLGIQMDDESVRKARADRLRKRIDELVKPKTNESAGDKSSDLRPESPREFVERKMREDAADSQKGKRG